MPYGLRAHELAFVDGKIPCSIATVKMAVLATHLEFGKEGGMKLYILLPCV